jgi:hypothetical protein
MIIILTFILSILSIFISYKLKDSNNDTLLILKLAGLYVLSVTTITINLLYTIPVGFFIAFILVIISNNNKNSKKICILLGLLSYIICVTLYKFI